MRGFPAKMTIAFAAVPALFLITFRTAAAQNPRLSGQFSAWLTSQPENRWRTQTGIRYIPLFQWDRALTETSGLAVEASVNTYGTLEGGRGIGTEREGEIKPYRLWLRMSTPRLEVRLGLQKINFGSASLLRPLMWFDRIDPRDPLQLTDGVYALLGRYFFLKKANVWLWALYGNDGTKGWEFMPTRERTVEFGGRLQLPVPEGEMALSFHQRKIDPEKGVEGIGALAGLAPDDVAWIGDLVDLSPVTERRLGLDGRWDIVVGFWAEGTLIRQEIDWIPYRYQRSFTLGLDYTFGIGNGLHVMAEHFRFEISEKAFGSGGGARLTALALDYPLGLLDSFTGMVYYDDENRDWYRFVQLKRMYDRTGFHLILFWNPEKFQLYQNLGRNDLYSGRGFQILFVYHH